MLRRGSKRGSGKTGQRRLSRCRAHSTFRLEHLELAKKRFPDPDAITNYLASRGVKVEELASGV